MPGLIWVGFAENPKEKHQLTALRGAETWGLIGSILGEFFWRAVCPPSPSDGDFGSRLSFLLPWPRLPSATSALG